MTSIIAVDSGTSSVRTIAFDSLDANTLFTSQKPIQQYYPASGYVEHDPLEIWQKQKETLDQVIESLFANNAVPCAIGITNQRETIVVWDKHTGIPIYNAIVWQDRRTAEFCRQLIDSNKSDLIKEKTGLEVDPYFSASKLKWILDFVDGAKEKAKNGDLLCGTIDSWLIWKMTDGKVHVTDASNASRTMLFNIQTLSWDQQLLDLFEIPLAMLPKLAESSGVVGSYRDIPIAGIIGDQQGALLGQACLNEGELKCTFGTGCFLLVNTGKDIVTSNNKLLSSVGWTIKGNATYVLEGSVFMGGAIIQWLRDNLKIIKNSEDIQQLASAVEDSGDVIMVPAFTGLGAPYWEPNAKAAILGMDRGTTSSHVARAAIEAIAHQVTDLTDAMSSDLRDMGREPIALIKADGGATKDSLLVQTVSDFSNLKIVRANITESTAWGAALLAAVAVNEYSSLDEGVAIYKKNQVFQPSADRDKIERLRTKWSRAVDLIRNY